MTVIGQDPIFRNSNGEMVLTQVEVPVEPLLPGPMGYRARVIDYDTTTGTLYRSRKDRLDEDPYERYLHRRGTERC